MRSYKNSDREVQGIGTFHQKLHETIENIFECKDQIDKNPIIQSYHVTKSISKVFENLTIFLNAYICLFSK